MSQSGKQLLNKASDVVRDNLEALCSQHASLRRLDGFPEVKVVLQSDLATDQHVSVISGGGAGHEPAHAGYVGAGWLAAAVVGEVFASPSASAILEAIRAVTGKAGCLIVLMNYTDVVRAAEIARSAAGDRLNFGLATELAKSEGYDVDLVVVGDDCALPGSSLAGRRGIAGSVFVTKIAGAAATAGLPLERVKEITAGAASSVGSMGMATQTGRLPGELPRSLAEDQVEMGLGLHGEPGAYRRKMTSADELVKEVADKILQYMNWPQQDAEYALLLNNLGITSNLEMGVLLRSAIHYLTAQHVRITRVFSGAFMTATDMSGFSISLLKLDNERKKYIDAEVQVSAWPNMDPKYSGVPAPVQLKGHKEEEFHRPNKLSEFGKLAEASLQAATEALINSAEQLDAWDRSVGDGDCGATVKRGAAAIQDALKEGLPLNDAAPLCHCLTRSVNAMGGTSGAIYNIFFAAAAGRLPKNGPASAKQISEAWQAGAEKIAFYGGAKEGSRTMLDALLPAVKAFSAAISAGESSKAAIQKAAQAAKEGSKDTQDMEASAGRSSYIPQKELKGIPDPGAEVVSIWLQAISEQL